jgi:protein involved in polysaccharide export with SLBB domain
MRVGDVLALAGGPSADAKADRVRLLRNGRVLVARLDGSALLLGLHSGDQIVVPRRGWVERNAGIIIGATLSALAILSRN